jgi:PEP-CTERM motif
MKKSFSGMLVAALALVGVLGTSSKANAALLIDFDNISFDGGTFTNLGGNNYSGTGIVFDTILFKDTTAGTTLGGLQCGVANTVAGATIADTCKLDFNTLLNTFTVTSPTGLWNIGADLLPYTADRGALVAGTTGNILTGSFTNWTDLGGVLFVGAGVDTKDAEMLAFFGLAPNTVFAFANTEIHVSPQGQVLEADLTNIVAVPEPATMMLLGTGLLAAFRARRKSA